MAFELEALEERRHLSAARVAGPDVATNASRLVFTAVNGSASRPQWVTLRNRGTAALSLESFALAGDDAARFGFRRRGIPTTLAPGGSVAVRVWFTPVDAAVGAARLEVRTNDRDTPLLAVTLRGLGTSGRYESAEPSLQRVLDTLQIPVNVGDADPVTSELNGSGGGEERLMPLLRKAGPGLVRVSVLAAFTWEESPVARVGWYRPRGDRATRQLLTVPAGNAQSLLPVVTGTSAFDPGSVTFGLYTQWPSESHAGAFSEDAMNGWNDGPDAGHAVRFYPYRTQSGRVVPGSYLVAMEQAANRDYQDTVLLIENVMPYDTVLPPVNLRATATSPGAVGLAWTDGSDNETSFVIERSRRKSGAFEAIGSVGAGVTAFTDHSAGAGTLYFYRVRAVNAARSSEVSNRVAVAVPVSGAGR